MLPRDAVERGPLDRVLLPARMFELAVRRETGLVLFQDGRRRKKIYLVEGVPEFIVSTDKTELLGEYLIARGQVLRMEVDMALAMLPRFGGRLGDALIGLGVLRPIELFRAIHEQTMARYCEVFQWRRGEMAFLRGERSHEETFPFQIDSFELIARGVREAYTVPELEAILAPLMEAYLEPILPLPVRIETFRLPEREAAVLRAIDGPVLLPRLCSDMKRRGIADLEEVYRAVFLGLACDIVKSSRWAAFTSQPPADPRSSERRMRAAR
jgi:serine/threonine-protein kinase